MEPCLQPLESGKSPSPANTFRKVPLASALSLNLYRSFVQPGNADNPPLRSRLSTFLFLLAGFMRGSLYQNLLKGFLEYRVCPVVLASIKNHSDLVESVLLSLQELDNCLESNRSRQP